MPLNDNVQNWDKNNRAWYFEVWALLIPSEAELSQLQHHSNPTNTQWFQGELGMLSDFLQDGPFGA